MKQVTLADIVFNIFNTLLMLVLITVCVYPFLYVVLASLSDATDLMSFSGLLWKPVGFSLDAYTEVFRNPNLITGYVNTLFYVVVGGGISLLLTIMGAFVLSRHEFFIKKAMNLMIVFTMFFSGGLIPFFLLVKGLGLYNNPFAFILPTAISTWNLMVMRTSFQGIPRSLEESAYLDGANEIHILFKIVVPLSKSIIMVIGLFYAVAIWNSWFNAAIFLKDRKYYPLQLFLREILIYSNTDAMMAGSDFDDKAALSETLKYAMIVIATIPILCAYPFLQKYFVKGVMIGAVKG